ALAIWKGRRALRRENFLSRLQQLPRWVFHSRNIASQTDPHELPPFFGLKEIPVGLANMLPRGRARAAAQNVLIAHELSVVLTERARPRPIARVRRIGAARPLPNVAEHLLKICRRSLTCRVETSSP